MADNEANQGVTNEKGVTRFKCPNCGKTEIVRTKHQRRIAVKYKCKSCDFSGPN